MVTVVDPRPLFGVGGVWVVNMVGICCIPSGSTGNTHTHTQTHPIHSSQRAVTTLPRGRVNNALPQKKDAVETELCSLRCSGDTLVRPRIAFPVVLAVDEISRMQTNTPTTTHCHWKNLKHSASGSTMLLPEEAAVEGASSARSESGMRTSRACAAAV